MKTPRYRPLIAAHRSLLREPAAADVRDEWHNASAALAGVVSLLSETYPRPMYFEGLEAEWSAVDESLDALRGTPFHDQVAGNFVAARELWQMWGQEGHTDALHGLVDAYLDELTADSLAVRHYPATPSAHIACPPALEHRAAV